MKNLKILVCGSRSIKDESYVFECIERSKTLKTSDELVSGGAIGVDSIAEKYAYEHNIPIKRFNADWKNLGKKAGILRDREMVEYADCVVAIWDGSSKGTKYTIDYTKQKGKPITIFIKN